MPRQRGDRITDSYSFIHLFIHSIFKFLEALTLCQPDIIPGAVRNRAVNKTHKTPALIEYISGLKQIINKKKISKRCYMIIKYKKKKSRKKRCRV